jgi:hypothetical protein
MVPMGSNWLRVAADQVKRLDLKPAKTKNIRKLKRSSANKGVFICMRSKSSAPTA